MSARRRTSVWTKTRSSSARWSKKGTELQVLSYEGTTDGVVDLYQVSYQGQTGYISGQYVSTVQEEANDVYDRFGVYAIHAGRGDKWGGGDAESLDYFPAHEGQFCG